MVSTQSKSEHYLGNHNQKCRNKVHIFFFFVEFLSIYIQYIIAHK